ncbi:MAG: hypothetical protein IJX65_07900 [Alistipes sp.]|nr:hypothetical protein [Alistipes sp.]
MRRFILLFLVLLCGTVAAQNRTVTREVDENGVVTITKYIPRCDTRHDLRLSIGSVSLMSMLYLDEGWGHEYTSISALDFRNQIKRADSYSSAKYFTGVISLSYGYNLRRWLQLGGTVNFAAITDSYKDNITNERVENHNKYFGSIMPTVRFIYFRREKVQFYSSVSLGLTITSYEPTVCYDATLFGCSFGRNLFGFAEIGNGIGGWGRIGIGYRFNSKK